MKRRITALSLLLAICLILPGCGRDVQSEGAVTTVQTVTETEFAVTTEPPVTEAVTDEAEGAAPLLYKVSDDEENVLWLFGSIHVGTESFYPLPDYIMDAFESSDALAVECDILEFESDLGAQMNAMQCLIYNDGTTISDHIPEDNYSKAVDILKDYGIYNSAFDYYMPVLWSNMIDSYMVMELDYDPELGIDRYLLDLAKTSSKKILEVESAEFQYNMMSEFSPELQEFLLRSSVESYADPELVEDGLSDLVSAWQSGDEDMITQLLAEEDDELLPEDVPLYEEYNNAMMIERNNGMTKYAEGALRSGKEIFICVGAAHIVGEGAVAQNLRDMGYTVEAVK